jgi:hypothetical protein
MGHRKKHPNGDILFIPPNKRKYNREATLSLSLEKV